MIKENLALCQEKISSAARKAGRPAEEITLVAVTKNAGLPLIYEAIDSGVRHIGENRVQEALLKYEPANTYARSRGFHLTWHMVGHLQTNKVQDAVRLFDLIHSVDSVRLAAEIDKQAAKIDKVQDVLLEVHVSPEATKSGFAEGEVESAVRRLTALKNVRPLGLMAIAPVVREPQEARPYFRRLRELRDKINGLRIAGYGLRDLSMGMTDDFVIGVEEGATLVRIGRGIFGERKRNE